MLFVGPLSLLNLFMQPVGGPAGLATPPPLVSPCSVIVFYLIAGFGSAHSVFLQERSPKYQVNTIT